MDNRFLPNELRLVAKTKLEGVPHAEVLLRAADVLEKKDTPVLVDMPIFLGEAASGAFLRIPWPMTPEEFRHLTTTLTSLHELYSWVGEPQEGVEMRLQLEQTITEDVR